MSFLCHIPLASLCSALISTLFVSADGARRMVTDHRLLQAELLDGERHLRLSSSCRTIEVAGHYRGLIFEGANLGTQRAVQAAPPHVGLDWQLWETSIIAIAPPEAWACHS